MIRTHGFMLPMALTVALFVLIFAVGGSYLLNTNLQIGGNLKANTIARYASEAGLDHALSWLEAKAAANQISTGESLTTLSVNQSNQGSYTVTFAWSANTLTVVSTGTGPRNAEYQSQLVLDITQGARQNPLFGQGWISGSRIELNGGMDFQTARVHGDLGFAALSGQVNYSPDGTSWTNISSMAVTTIPISGGQGVATQSCNATGGNTVVCSGSQMYNRFCPVYQTTSAGTTCDDMTTPATTLIDASTSARITAPNVASLVSAATSTAIISATNDMVTQATSAGMCTASNTRALTAATITATNFRNLFTTFASNPGIGNDTRKVLCLTRSPATTVSVTGTGLNLSNYRLVLNFPLTFISSATLASIDIYTATNLTLNSVAATSSKFYSGGTISMNSSASFAGNSTVASRLALTFNGSANLLANTGLAVISEGNVTFNGASGIKALMWAGGTVTFNGTGTYEGGAVALGNIIRNGGGQYTLKANNSIENTDLPQTGGLPSVNVLSRR